MKNHLGSYECQMCHTVHHSEAEYLAHTQGKRHQNNLQKRSASDSPSPAMHAPISSVPPWHVPTRQYEYVANCNLVLAPTSRQTSALSTADRLIQQQNADGSWNLTDTLSTVLSVSSDVIKSAVTTFLLAHCPQLLPAAEQVIALWTTILVLKV